MYGHSEEEWGGVGYLPFTSKYYDLHVLLFLS